MFGSGAADAALGKEACWVSEESVICGDEDGERVLAALERRRLSLPTGHVEGEIVRRDTVHAHGKVWKSA